ncbi:MAG: D-alanyl-D-alanine carboxypeptidase [Christensenellaceae bacterium]|nr:D-alanyl-D-alanine carboxypeptidase [Christensenellaceae bacterium]
MPRLLRLICVLLALCCPLAALAEDTPQATIDPNAAPYDAEHPEDLSPDQLAAVSAILIEQNSGMVIFEKNADQLMFPASTTKIMTALLCILSGNLDDTTTVSANAIYSTPEGSSKLGVREGEELNVRDLLYGTMITSGNDGANVIAEYISGSISAFVDLMNQAASVYGMTNTHFSNPHGFQDEYHYTTVRDMAVLAREAMKNDVFRDIAQTTSYNMPRTNQQRSRTVSLSRDIRVADYSNYYPYATGIKTGTTSNAGYCFVGSATKDGVDLISVVFYSGYYDRWRDTKKLFEYGFSQYVSVTPIDLYNMNPIWVQTSGYSLNDANMGKLDLTCVPVNASATAEIVATQAEVDMMASNLRDTVLIDYTRDFVAPISAGEVVGTMTYFPENQSPVVYNLIASRTVSKRENTPKTLDQIAAETEADPNPFPPLSIWLVLLFLSPLLAYIVVVLILRFIFRVLRKRQAKLPRNSRRYVK